MCCRLRGVPKSKIKRTYYKDYNALSRQQQWRRQKALRNDVIKYLASGHDGITIENETPRAMSSISNDMAVLNADSINVQQEKIIENSTVDSEPENEAKPRDNDQAGAAINASNHINSELAKEGTSSDIMVTENLYSITNILKTWAVSETNVPKSSVSNLLKQLHRIHNELPKSFYSLLPRPQLFIIKICKKVYSICSFSKLDKMSKRCFGLFL